MRRRDYMPWTYQDHLLMAGPDSPDFTAQKSFVPPVGSVPYGDVVTAIPQTLSFDPTVIEKTDLIIPPAVEVPTDQVESPVVEEFEERSLLPWIIIGGLVGRKFGGGSMGMAVGAGLGAFLGSRAQRGA